MSTPVDASAALRRVRAWTVVRAGMVVLGLGLVGATVALRSHNAWGSGSTWPRYACVHRGRAFVFSSAWNGGWLHGGWIYDCIGPKDSWVWPTYERIGDTYDGTPSYVTNLYAVGVPLWNLAIPALGGAWWAHRRRGRAMKAMHGFCAECGYSLAGLSGATCPECGGRAG